MNKFKAMLLITTTMLNYDAWGMPTDDDGAPVQRSSSMTSISSSAQSHDENYGNLSSMNLGSQMSKEKRSFFKRIAKRMPDKEKQAAALRKLGILKLSDLSLNDLQGQLYFDSLGINEERNKVTHIDFSNCHIDDETVENMIADTFPNLEKLTLANNKIGNIGVRRIAHSFPKLRSLNLAGNQVGAEGIESISENLKKLRSLNLERNKIDKTGAQTLAANLTALEKLYLKETEINNEGAKAIIDKCQSLKVLDLEATGIDHEIAARLAQSSHSTHLEILNLSHNNLGNKGAEEIALSVKWSNLKELYVNNTGLGQPGIFAFLHMTHPSTALMHLEIIGNVYNTDITETVEARKKAKPQLKIIRLPKDRLPKERK